MASASAACESWAAALKTVSNWSVNRYVFTSYVTRAKRDPEKERKEHLPAATALQS